MALLGVMNIQGLARPLFFRLHREASVKREPRQVILLLTGGWQPE